VLEINEDQFKRFQTLIYKHCGIRLDDRKQLLLRTRLQRRLRQISMDDVEKYLGIVTRPDGTDELQSLIDVVTTNETSFFRTQSHFDWFSKVFLPEVHSRRVSFLGNRELRIWSAACSNGAEAYSLSFCLHNHRALVNGLKVKIIASDLCVAALDQAKTAKYPQRFVDTLAPSTRKQFFDEIVAAPGASSSVPREYQVRSEFRNQVEWVHHNLMHPLQRPLMDCVFLRNVLIYFDDVSKQTVLTNVINQILPGGYLVVGPSEGIYGLDNPLTKINTFLYQKNPK
jgi:chemotaxis protein methyltransferase CheR